MSGVRLIAAGHTRALRRAIFGGDEPLDEGGRQAATALHPAVRGTWVTAPSLAARETVQAFGASATVEPALRDPDYGKWDGLALDDIDPGQLSAWLTDPAAAPHGGESLTDVTQRTGEWLTGHAGRHLTAVAHPIIVRAAAAAALDLPMWKLDVAPLTVVRLTHHTRGWHLHL